MNKNMPSTNLQAPEKLQTPDFKNSAGGARVWSFGFGVSLELGAWSLVLSLPS
jgi:hypothetical protein